jgi:salicylate hydroxylase
MSSYGLERRVSRKARGALARYEDIRKDRTAMVVQKPHENRKQVFSPALANKDEVAASVARDWQQVRVQERLDWLYAYDATSAEI